MSLTLLVPHDRHFRTKRGNVCTVLHMADGELRARWAREPTRSDLDEFAQFRAFAEGVLHEQFTHPDDFVP